jgi:membrane protease YdiL (CAAX protease family)
MPTAVDLAFSAIFVLVPVVQSVVDGPRFERAVAAGDPDARANAYRATVATLWLLTGAAVAFWLAYGRSARSLGLVPAGGATGLALSAAVVAFMCWFIVTRARKYSRLTPAKRERLRLQLDQLRLTHKGFDFLVPHTRAEFRWFTAMSFTAGFCEELLYRGYLVWVLAAYLGLGAAVLASAILFAAAHTYQGWRGMLKVVAVALVFNLIVLGTGWLIPAMLVHTLFDLPNGLLGYNVYVVTEPNLARAT